MEPTTPPRVGESSKRSKKVEELVRTFLSPEVCTCILCEGPFNKFQWIKYKLETQPEYWDTLKDIFNTDISLEALYAIKDFPEEIRKKILSKVRHSMRYDIALNTRIILKPKPWEETDWDTVKKYTGWMSYSRRIEAILYFSKLGLINEDDYT